MTDAQRRLLGGTCFLAALWILVYWLWQPSRAAIRFDRASPEPPAGERPDPTDHADAESPSHAPTPERSPPPRAGAEGPGSGSSGPGIRDPLERDPPRDVTIDPGRAPPPIAPPRFRDYTIRPDDTFEAIALRELGSRARVGEILAANPGKDPRRLRLGDVIRIPVDPAGTANAAGAGQPGGSPPANPTTPVQPAIPATYTVRGGDTLSEISQRIYGTVRHATLIFEANRDQLRSPDDIHEGQVLRIPPAPR